MRRAVPILVVGLLAAVWLVVGPTKPVLAAPQECATTKDYKPRQTTWALQRLQPKRVWDLAKGAGVTVAVIDTGIETEHPQLQGQVVGAKDYLSGVPGSATDDCFGHGTMVAGIIAAKPIEGIGFYGVAPEADLLSYRQSDDEGGKTNVLAQAIVDAVDEGADVINVSSTAPTDYSDVRQAVRYAAENDVVVVAAAGNDNLKTGQPECQVCYPAAYDDLVLAVGAVAPKDKPADVSHEGSYVDVAAPGEEIVSTGPLPIGGYAANSGTSFAAPYVAGVVALVRSYYPDMPAEQVRQRIKVTADPPVQGKENVLTGVGVVNPYAAVTQVIPDSPAVPPPPEQAVLPPPPSPPDHTARNVVIGSVVMGALTVVVVATAGAALPRGRRRRWQPGRWHPSPEEELP